MQESLGSSFVLHGKQLTFLVLVDVFLAKLPKFPYEFERQMEKILSLLGETDDFGVEDRFTIAQKLYAMTGLVIGIFSAVCTPFFFVLVVFWIHQSIMELVNTGLNG
jgi:hypothetical protein